MTCHPAVVRARALLCSFCPPTNDATPIEETRKTADDSLIRLRAHRTQVLFHTAVDEHDKLPTLLRTLCEASRVSLRNIADK